MFKDRFVKVMLVVIALLLAANLIKENVAIKPVFAASSSDAAPMPPASIGTAGNTTWILVGSQLFYATVDNYNRIQIYGPERLKY